MRFFFVITAIFLSQIALAQTSILDVVCRLNSDSLVKPEKCDSTFLKIELKTGASFCDSLKGGVIPDTLQFGIIEKVISDENNLIYFKHIWSGKMFLMTFKEETSNNAYDLKQLTHIYYLNSNFEICNIIVFHNGKVEDVLIIAVNQAGNLKYRSPTSEEFELFDDIKPLTTKELEDILNMLDVKYALPDNYWNDLPCLNIILKMIDKRCGV